MYPLYNISSLLSNLGSLLYNLAYFSLDLEIREYKLYSGNTNMEISESKG